MRSDAASPSSTRIGACDVMLASGRAKQCPQVVIGGVECDNALRKWLARKKYDRESRRGRRGDGEEEDDDEARPTVALEDDELLYRLFELLALGGPLAQPDLELDHYLKATKASCAPGRPCVQIARKRSSGRRDMPATRRMRWRGPLVLETGTRGPSRGDIPERSGPRRLCCSRRRGGWSVPFHRVADSTCG